MQQICVLGATGSIGLSTLNVIGQHPEYYKVFALTAHQRIKELAELCIKYKPMFAVVTDKDKQQKLQLWLNEYGLKTEVLQGKEALCCVASHPQVDAVMAAIIGAAGLEPTLAAVKAGKKVLLANKESLVMSGALFMQTVKDSRATLLPIDSEHNAIFQCLPRTFNNDLKRVGVRRILLTGSGGPFRDTPFEQLTDVTPVQACAHPNWSMGKKISVDSATMMNKGLEFIEACWLFNAKPEQIEVVIQPQSVIHSMVDYIDGSIIAQLANPDMRTPIAHALAWPDRMTSGVTALDLLKIGRLDFLKPDERRFPCLYLAKEAMNIQGTAPTILNAANEIAVEAFLKEQIKFTMIEKVIAETLNKLAVTRANTLELILAADKKARILASSYIKMLG